MLNLQLNRRLTSCYEKKGRGSTCTGDRAAYISMASYAPLHVASQQGDVDKVKELLEHGKYSVNSTDSLGRSPLYHACVGGHLNVVRVLVSEYKADMTIQDASGITALNMAAKCGHESIVCALLEEYGCPVDAKDNAGQTVLHYACKGGSVSLVRTLIIKYKADVNARTNNDDPPLHVAARYDQLEVVIALINDFKCDVNVKGHLGRSLLHSACSSSGSHGVIVEYVSRYLSPLLVDDDGNTPLHTACSVNGSMPLLKSLLKYNPPMLMRNVHGQTPLDMATLEGRGVLDQYMVQNKDKIYADYSSIQTLAKKKYSSAEPITRIFVVGNPGVGKSSLIETLKREGFFESFRRVFESSVPSHTAGIVPSIHTSKHYGRSLFYDFAGDPEYYSSHAAILENLVSSKKGDNIFIIVVNLSDMSIREILHYWLLFIQHQNFGWKEPYLIIIGSHSDIIAREKISDVSLELKRFCDKIQPGHGVLHKAAHFILDCRNPKHKHLGDIQKCIASYTKNSPRYALSLYASTLLGLLEKDFSKVSAFSVAQLQSHIEEIHIALPSETQLLHSLLLELHDIGLLFIVNGSNKEHFHVVFNISKLTNEVHRLLFSDEAKLRLSHRCIDSREGIFSFNIGIIPGNVLKAILPGNIPWEFLVQLQYCQQISHKDVGVFPSLTPSYSTDQSFLFFPALCSVDKSEVSWVTPPDLSYSIGWLARCTNPCDYFPIRFLHVLLLRLVTLSVPAQSQASGASPNHSHFQHRYTMWRKGVRWLMEEGVECMVELVNGKEVVVTTKSIEDRAQNCTIVFSKIISCVMEAKSEFCHSIKPQFFILYCTDEAIDYLSDDNLFAMSDVDKALIHYEGNSWILSVSGKVQMDHSKFHYMRMFTDWVNLFSIDFNSILDYLANVVFMGLYEFGRYLGISHDILSAIEADFPTDTNIRRKEIVRKWMSSNQGYPCWWHLVEALKRIDHRVLAERIQEEHGKSIATSMDASLYLYFNRCCLTIAKETFGPI